MPHINPWFPKAKFGVFIHWGLHHPISKSNTGHTQQSIRAEAGEAAKLFKGDKFDGYEWGRMFASWGAKYAVLTTKHHIGFALFDHKDCHFSAAKHSGAQGRDFVAEYAEGLRAHGIKVGLYYSLPDWTHPDYASLAGGDDPKKYSPKDDPQRWRRFTDYMFNEIEHLLTAYGKIDLMWFDGDWERSAEQWRSEELTAMMLEKAPHLVINNRLRHLYIGHYGTPETIAPIYPRNDVFEFCTTLGNTWGVVEDDEHKKSVNELVRMFGDNLRLGGNLLLNIAPPTAGNVPDNQVELMAGLGSWITSHKEAVYGSQVGLPADLFYGGSTTKGSVLYLIVYDYPREELIIKGIQSECVKITHLATGEQLSYRLSGGRPKFGNRGWIVIKTPPHLEEKYATVFKLEFADNVLQYVAPDGSIKVSRGRPILEEGAV